MRPQYTDRSPATYLYNGKHAWDSMKQNMPTLKGEIEEMEKFGLDVNDIRNIFQSTLEKSIADHVPLKIAERTYGST